MTDPLISVVVPAYNAEATIGTCVAALRGQQFDAAYEIIVVNDGSTDRTAAIATDAGAIVITTPNGRPAAARNVGIRAARGHIICFTDADCAAHPDWLQQITAPLQDPDVAACKGTYSTQQRELVARFVQIEYEDKYDLLRSASTIDFIDTYSAAYRRDVLLANNGFDERFDYLEDQELSFRLAARGYKMVFQPAAVVDHLHASTLNAYLRKKQIIGYWKSQVVRRFPDRAVKDSHTPQAMKVQMGLSVLLIPSLIVGVAGAVFAPLFRTRGKPGIRKGSSGQLLAPFSLLTLLFLASTIPFARKAWSKDRWVALLSPALLFGRALALSAGYAKGVFSPRPAPNQPTTKTGISARVKRVIDLSGSILGLIFTIIVWPLIALLIKLDSEGPVLFSHKRVGAQGRPFTMYKFRTMHKGAADQWPQLVTSLGLSEPVLKLADDPRLTGVGRFLRRWSLDELPQFWNVLKGDMSLVGPRPEEPRVVAYYSNHHLKRLAVKPGMTGPMQISDRADMNLDERVALDLDYIEHHSTGRDLGILLRTLPVIIRGKGAR